MNSKDYKEGSGMMTDEERRIQKKIEELKGGDYKKIREEQKRKRLDWWERNKDNLRLSGSLPKQASKMVLFECLGINPKEIKIIHDSQTKISWQARNFCPVVEACRRLGLETKEVCREVYQEPVQVLISRLNPNLFFSRNYDRIRPYAEYCEESIEWLTYLEDQAIRGPCVFRKVKKGPLYCGFKIKDCGKEDNNLSECTKYSMLGDELIKWMNNHAGPGCASCLKRGIQKVKCDDGVWRTREEFFNPDIKGSPPPDIWERFYEPLPLIFCRKCREEK